MDKNLKEKLKNLFRKEGFYIALFLCLCIVVTVGTISYKMLNSKNQVNKTEDVNKDLTMNSGNEGNSNNSVQNAERVENAQNNSNKDNADKTKTEKAASVSTNNTVTFVNPIDGVESRKYT